MKIVCFLFPVAFAVLTGCSKSPDVATTPPPDAKMTVKQNLERVQNDSQMPEGLKRIKMESMQRQPGFDR